jgi:uncharacterized protein YbjQ (UPF0145 family)
MRTPAVLLAAIVLAGCSTSGTSIQLGEATSYPATDLAAVALLIAPPQREHEIIALVEGVAATDDYLTKARTEAAAIGAMKKEAARIGAHAIVLTGKNSTPYGQIGYATTTGSAVVTGNTVSGYATTVSSGLGWEKITFSGTAVRYKDAAQ